MIPAVLREFSLRKLRRDAARPERNEHEREAIRKLIAFYERESEQCRERAA